MRRIFVSLFTIIVLFSMQSIAENAPMPAPYDYTKCASASPTGGSELSAYRKSCKSRARRAKEAKAKCEAISDITQKETCLKVLEDKAAKKAK